MVVTHDLVGQRLARLRAMDLVDVGMEGQQWVEIVELTFSMFCKDALNKLTIQLGVRLWSLCLLTTSHHASIRWSVSLQIGWGEPVAALILSGNLRDRDAAFLDR